MFPNTVLQYLTLRNLSTYRVFPLPQMCKVDADRGAVFYFSSPGAHGFNIAEKGMVERGHTNLYLSFARGLKVLRVGERQSKQFRIASLGEGAGLCHHGQENKSALLLGGRGGWLVPSWLHAQHVFEGVAAL